MSRVIDIEPVRNYLLKEIDRLFWEGRSIGNGYKRKIAGALSSVITIIDAQQPVGNVKHGKWKFHEPDEHGNRKPYCSECRTYKLSNWSDYAKCKICPNCGAKMDGDSING